MKKEHTRKFAMMAIILISTIMLTGCGAKLAGDSGSNATQSSKVADDAQTEVAKYEGILQAARTLTEDQSYEESNAQLNSMSVTDLAKPEFKAIKTAADELRQTNTDGVATQQQAKAEKKAQKAKPKPPRKRHKRLLPLRRHHRQQLILVNTPNLQGISALLVAMKIVHFFQCTSPGMVR